MITWCLVFGNCDGVCIFIKFSFLILPFGGIGSRLVMVVMGVGDIAWSWYIVVWWSCLRVGFFD